MKVLNQHDYKYRDLPRVGNLDAAARHGDGLRRDHLARVLAARRGERIAPEKPARIGWPVWALLIAASVALAALAYGGEGPIIVIQPTGDCDHSIHHGDALRPWYCPVLPAPLWAKWCATKGPWPEHEIDWKALDRSRYPKDARTDVAR